MRFEVVAHSSDGLVWIRDNKTGRTNAWIRGFTYKAWICAETGQVIPASSRTKKRWAWRISRPKTVEESMFRITAKVVDMQLS